jgi:hypothetical protein
MKIPLFLDRWWCSLGEFDLLLRLPEPETALEIVLSAFLTGFGEILVGTLDPVVRLSPRLKCRALFKLLSGLVCVPVWVSFGLPACWSFK